ncbi:MAG: acyl-CoA-binding protein [Alcanivoracaceae bacterium]|nr:acyl-CoA-binding protein [Alcanivoracaceae bacterium]
MSNLNELFEKAQKDVKSLTDKPGNDILLALYSYYKQGTQGDVQGDKPGFFDFVGASKYEAWEALKGTSKEGAMQKYIDQVARLID